MTAPRRKCTCGASAPGGYGPCICSSTPVPPASPEPERPGGWVDGVGWVALSSDLTSGDDNVATWPEEPGVLGSRFVSPVIVVRWADGTRPAPPSPEARPDEAADDSDALYDELVAAARSGCCDERRKPCERHDAYADAVECTLSALGHPDRCATPAPTGERVDGRLSEAVASLLRGAVRVNSRLLDRDLLLACGEAHDALAALASTPAPPSGEGARDDLIERLYDANGIEDLNHQEGEVRSLLSEAADALAADDEDAYLRGRHAIIDSLRTELNLRDIRRPASGSGEQ